MQVRLLARFGSKYYRSNKRRKKIFFDVITYTILIAFAFIMIYPFWWMISASFAGNKDHMITGSTWWPSYTAAKSHNGDLFANYANVITIAAQGGTTFWQSVGVTLLYSLVPVTIGIITSTMAAFAFAKLNFKGKNVVFFYCLAGIMIPGPSIMITQYCIYTELGWTLNGLAMIIPGCFGAVMTAFFIRQYLYGMPTAIIEAAKIDGAGYWRIFWQFVVRWQCPRSRRSSFSALSAAGTTTSAPCSLCRAMRGTPWRCSLCSSGKRSATIRRTILRSWRSPFLRSCPC